MPQRMTRDLRVCREGSYYDLGDCAGEVIAGIRARSAGDSLNLIIYFHSMAGRQLVLVLERTPGRTRTARIVILR